MRARPAVQEGRRCARHVGRVLEPDRVRVRARGGAAGARGGRRVAVVTGLGASRVANAMTQTHTHDVRTLRARARALHSARHRSPAAALEAHLQLVHDVVHAGRALRDAREVPVRAHTRIRVRPMGAAYGKCKTARARTSRAVCRCSSPRTSSRTWRPSPRAAGRTRCRSCASGRGPRLLCLRAQACARPTTPAHRATVAHARTHARSPNRTQPQPHAPAATSAR